MIKNDIDLLKELCLKFGPSGYEDDVRDYIHEQIKDYCDDIKVDKLGNLIATLHGSNKGAPKFMISAHMDEVGFMVADIDSDGYLKFYTLGGIDPRVLCSRSVCIRHEERQTGGVIASMAIHHQKKEDMEKTTPLDKMYIDIGAKDKDDAGKFVSVGDFGTFRSDFILFGKDEKMIKSKAIDDRLGCAVMIEAIRHISKSENSPASDIVFAFSVREEVGYSGALTAAYSICPDFAIVLESTAIADIADVPTHSRVAHVGDGGVISLCDKATIYDSKFIEFALETANEKNIPVQIKKYLSGGNDANHIHKSRAGVRTLALSAATRYLHSSSCVASVNDYYSIKKLTIEMLSNTEKLFAKYEV